MDMGEVVSMEEMARVGYNTRVGESIQGGMAVRQASLRELAQQILAKEKISNSPRGKFSKQQLIHVEGFQRQQLIACTHN